MPSLGTNRIVHTMEKERENHRCSCCPYGFHIDRGFVPFTKRMLAREGDFDRLQELKDKWRSERQSMNSLLGIDPTVYHKGYQLFERESLSRASIDIWRREKCVDEEVFESEKLEIYRLTPPVQADSSEINAIYCNTNYTTSDRKISNGLAEAVNDFEEVLQRTRPSSGILTFEVSGSDNQKFHTFPRRFKPGIREDCADSSLDMTRDSNSFRPAVSRRFSQNESQENLKNNATNSYHKFCNHSRTASDSEKIKKLEEEIKSMAQLRNQIKVLSEENKELLKIIDENKGRNVNNLTSKSESLLSTTNIRRPSNGVSNFEPIPKRESLKMSQMKKRTRDIGIETTIKTKDVGVGIVPSKCQTRTIGVGGSIDVSVLEKTRSDSISPNGSLGRKRIKRPCFEIGIQVQELDLESRNGPSLPILQIIESNDVSVQTDEIQDLPTNLEVSKSEEKPILHNVSVSAKPRTRDFGITSKPRSVDAFINTDEIPTSEEIKQQPELKNKSSNTELSVELSDTLGKVTEEKSPPLAPVKPSRGKVCSSPESERNHMLSLSLKDGRSTSPLSTSPIVSRIPIPSTSPKLAPRSHSFEPADSSNKRPTFNRSDTYTKDIHEKSPGPIMSHSRMQLEVLEEEKNSELSNSSTPSPAIPMEPREKILPSKEMQGALKVLNDALLIGRTTQQVTSAISVILHEWFRISAPKKANPFDVEDYLDCFEGYSPQLLRYIVNMPDGNGNNAIHYAVSHGNFDVVSVLLDSKVVDPNKANKAGYTCIMLVSLARILSESHRQVVRRLFSLGDVNIKAAQHRQTALMLASSHGRFDTVRLLLEAEADINIRDGDGSTALMCATEHGHGEIVKYLLAQPDCDPNIVDNDGSTALSVAMEAGHKDIGVMLYAHMHFMKSPVGSGSPRHSLIGRRSRTSSPGSTQSNSPPTQKSPLSNKKVNNKSEVARDDDDNDELNVD